MTLTIEEMRATYSDLKDLSDDEIKEIIAWEEKWAVIESQPEEFNKKGEITKDE